METIAGGKTPGLCLVEALPAEVVALGISICDTTRDGSRIVGQPEVIPPTVPCSYWRDQGHTCVGVFRLHIARHASRDRSPHEESALIRAVGTVSRIFRVLTAIKLPSTDPNGDNISKAESAFGRSYVIDFLCRR